jgi:hypothetical protein
MEKSEIIKLAKQHNWEIIADQPDNVMVSFFKNGARINVWYTKMTVATVVNHPLKGRNQLYRKHVSNKLMEQIFINPRVHTPLGYRTK